MANPNNDNNNNNNNCCCCFFFFSKKDEVISKGFITGIEKATQNKIVLHYWFLSKLQM